LIDSLARRVIGNAYVLTQLFGQRAVPFAPRQRIERLRDARVRRMVRHAAATVPFYREAFQRLSIRPEEIRTADDLARLPLVEKDDLRRDPDRFLSGSRLGRTSVPFVTSGSTGTRARIHHDRLGLLANIAFGERERQVVARAIGSEAGYREAAIGYTGGTFDKVLDFYRDNTYVPIRPDRLLLSVQARLRDNVEALNRFLPDVLIAYGNYLHALSRAVSTGTVKLASPKLLIYVAEAITPQVRREIEDVLGAPVLSFYNAVEAFKIGFLCEHRRGFHVHEDLAHLRILGANGDTAPDGESGCVVLSNLVNRATVLLNYRLSDMASFAPGPCPCGRTLRSLAEVDGRVEDMLTLDNGEVLHPRGIWAVIKPHGEIIQCQLIQQAPRRFLLKLVTADEPAYRRVSGTVVRDLERLLGNAAVVETARCAEIPREAGGKVRLVVALK
jgi:phenylacetate-coenzyme A ligase PaaK-like adenylate-forming protein